MTKLIHRVPTTFLLCAGNSGGALLIREPKMVASDVSLGWRLWQLHVNSIRLCIQWLIISKPFFPTTYLGRFFFLPTIIWLQLQPLKEFHPGSGCVLPFPHFPLCFASLLLFKLWLCFTALGWTPAKPWKLFLNASFGLFQTNFLLFIKAKSTKLKQNLSSWKLMVISTLSMIHPIIFVEIYIILTICCPNQYLPECLALFS